MNDDQCFVDTNIWLYAFIQNQDPKKYKIARELLSKNEIIFSSQVVNEICLNLINKGFLS